MNLQLHIYSWRRTSWQLMLTRVITALYVWGRCEFTKVVICKLRALVNTAVMNGIPHKLLRTCSFPSLSNRFRNPYTGRLSSLRRRLVILAGLESPEYGRKDPSRWPRGTLYPQKLALTSPTSSGRSVGRHWCPESEDSSSPKHRYLFTPGSGFSETLVPIYQTTQSHPRQLNPNVHWLLTPGQRHIIRQHKWAVCRIGKDCESRLQDNNRISKYKPGSSGITEDRPPPPPISTRNTWKQASQYSTGGNTGHTSTAGEDDMNNLLWNNYVQYYVLIQHFIIFNILTSIF
jgi:hypothetical protein